MTKTDKILKSMKQQNMKVTPIGTDIILPNYSSATGSSAVNGNFKNIGLEKLIKEELEILGLIKFWDERPNDFF